MSKSVRNLHDKFPISEIYQLSQGERGAPGMLGYQVPKTYDYNYHDIAYLFPKEKRHDATTDAKKRSKDPDPTKYAPDMQTASKKEWKSIGALFGKAKRETHIEQVMRLSKDTPGPGMYLEEARSFSPPPMGKFE